MKTWMHGLTAAMAAAVLAAGCSSSDLTTEPNVSRPSFAKGAGTAVPTQPASTPAPTVSVTALLFPGTNVLVSQSVSLQVIATSEGGNRKAPLLTVVNAPAGFSLVSSVIANSPSGGGPGYVMNIYSYTPSRDQIGSLETVTFSVTSSASATLTASATYSFGTVQEAPSAVSNLTATNTGDHIEAHWTASIGGVGIVTYRVQACYRTAGLRTQPSQCDDISTTTDTQELAIPRANPNPTLAPLGGIATYFAVLVTPIDEAGHPGPAVSAIVQ